MKMKKIKSNRLTGNHTTTYWLRFEINKLDFDFGSSSSAFNKSFMMSDTAAKQNEKYESAFFADPHEDDGLIMNREIHL